MMKNVLDEYVYNQFKDKFDMIKFDVLLKGWSPDRKYFIETKDNDKYLLRVADIKALERKKNEYEMLKIAATTNILMSYPIEFGYLDNGNKVYQLLQWVEGVDFQDAMADMTQEKRYQLGYKAGRILKKLHSIPATLQVVHLQGLQYASIHQNALSPVSAAIFLQHVHYPDRKVQSQ